MTKKLKQVLADANVVINAHEYHFWEQLCSAYRIALSASVLENELFYFTSAKRKKGLNPFSWIKQGKVIQIDADIKSLDMVSRKLTSDYKASLDLGEFESLAILHSKDYSEILFSTADKALLKR